MRQINELNELNKEMLALEDDINQAYGFMEKAKAVLSAIENFLFTDEECNPLNYQVYYDRCKQMCRVVRDNIQNAIDVIDTNEI